MFRVSFTCLFLCGLLCVQPPLFADVLFTPRAERNAQGTQAVMRSWNALAAADPSGRAAAWLKKQGEAGYIGDITVDFDDVRLRAAGGALGMWDMAEKKVILPNRLAEPYLSAVIAHEAGGHAYFDTIAPYIDTILPPRYAVAMYMIREIGAFIQEAKVEGRRGNFYSISETITEPPKLENNVINYFFRLRKYIADANPVMDEAALWQAACNEFALGFLSSEAYIDRGIDSLEPQFYELLYAMGRYYTPPALNRQNGKYMANINIIMRKYLQAAMPDGVALTLDIDTFMNELSHRIDAADRRRKARGRPACLEYDRLLAESIQKAESPGNDVRDGGMVINPDVTAWLDALIGPQKQEFQIVPALRALRYTGPAK